MRYLSDTGLAHLWSTIKTYITNQLNNKADKTVASTTSDGLMSSTDKSYLDTCVYGADDDTSTEDQNPDLFDGYQRGAFVLKDDDTSTEDQNPDLFDGYQRGAFVLKIEVVDNQTTTAVNVPLSANQGYLLAQSISGLNTSLSNLTSTVSSHTSTLSSHTTSINSLNNNALLKSSVVDNVSSSATDVPLSANQGNVLSGRITDLNTSLSDLTSTVSSHTSTLSSHTTSINSLNNNALLKSSVVNSLISTTTDAPLSAYQGKVLNDNKLAIAGGSMTGILTAYSNTSYTTKQVRNIFLSTSTPTSSDGANGDIWIVYTA